MFDHQELSTQELESVVANLNDFIAHEHNSELPKIINALEDLDLHAIEKLCHQLISSKYTLTTLSIKVIYSVFYKQYDSASDQNSQPYAAQFFSSNIEFDDSLLDLIENHFERLAQNNIEFIASLLTNDKVDPKVAIHYLCITEEYENTHELLLNILSSRNTQAIAPFTEIVKIILEKNHNWIFNLLLMRTFTKQMKTIDPDEINELENRIEREFLSKFQKNEVAQTDLENNFIRGNLSPLQTKMVDGVAALLSIDTMSPATRKLAIEEIFTRKNAKENDIGYMNYLTFILNNVEEYSDFLKNIEFEHSFIAEQLIHYKIEPTILKKVNFVNFFNNETRYLIGPQCYKLLSDVILRSCDRIVNRAQFYKMTPIMLANIYNHSLTDLSSMIFINQAHDLKENPIEEIRYPDRISIYYNNQGYISEASNSDRLFLENTETTPIGYNVYLPPLGVKCENVVVNVYGGHKIGTDNAYGPGELGDFYKSLLIQGTAVITLNLPDLLELTVYQGNMPIDLHIKIHACIDKFYQTIKNSPEKLHEDLKEYGLQNKPIFLYGASFGGALSIRHGQMHPDTFSGYISHDGPLSRELSKKSDLLNRAPAEIWLDPAQPEGIANMIDPVLLMHTKSDNNVSEKETEAFYKTLQKNGKSHLAKVHITTVGNPIFTDKYSKGHAIPTDKDEFMHYINTISSYMKNGPAVLPAMTKWQVYRHNKLANKFYKSATLQQRFIAEILDKERVYRTEKSNFMTLLSGKEAEIDAIWDTHYEPLFYAMHYANSLCQNKSDLINEIKRLIDTQSLSHQVIQNALSYQSSAFSQYVKENYNIEITQEQIKNTPELLEQFNLNLKDLPLKEPPYVRYMLSSLYLSNPHILFPLYTQFEAISELQHSSNLAKHKLVHTLSKERKMITHVWQQTVKRTLQKEQSKQVTNLSDLSDIKKHKK